MEQSVELSSEARRAAIAGTRQMIANESFGALVALLVDCRAVPKNVMAATLERLSDHLIAKARDQLESDFQIYPAEIFDRARDLSDRAASLRAAS
jgi:hypothetical protein